jgi:ribA/ribD-fused uncharacterized protein
MSQIDNFKGQYAFLSNFGKYTIAWKGARFPTLEHAYQWAKATNDVDRAAIASAQTPGDAKRAGRRCTIRADWDQVKNDIMLELLRIKFKNDYLAYLLICTGDAELIEGNTWGDVYWGVCKGVGQNMLGKLLMQVRREIEEN